MFGFLLLSEDPLPAGVRPRRDAAGAADFFFALVAMFTP
jgi:hypothetical protein